jgi:hypothetical protein
MDRYERLNSRLIGLSLNYGKVTLNPSHSSTLFYIVEHTEDAEIVNKEAMQMVMQTGVDTVFFYGKKEAVWHFAFDTADIEIYGDKREEVILTCSCDSIEDFVDEIKSELSIRTFIPLDCYLIYDDKGIYDDVKRRLGC